MKKPEKVQSPETTFVEVVALIQSARQKAFQTANSTLIERNYSGRCQGSLCRATL